MALEYVLQADADISTTELRAFYASVLAGEREQDGTVFRPGMYVTARHVTEDEASPLTQLFGFEHKINATYRFRNSAEPAEQDDDTVAMTSSVLKLIERYGGRGVLLFNGERAVIEWRPGEVAFDSEWEDWSELEAVAPLIDGHTLRRLPQPLL